MSRSVNDATQGSNATTTIPVLKSRVLTMVIAVAIIAAGCNNSDDDGSTTDAAATSPPTVSTISGSTR